MTKLELEELVRHGRADVRKAAADELRRRGIWA